MKAANSAYKSRVILIISLLLATQVTACVTTPTPPPKPEMTQLQMRQIQTNDFPSIDIKVMTKAVISSLQDEGYIIGTADKDLGLVTAAMEIFDEDKQMKGYVQFFYGTGRGNYQTTKRFEVSITIRKHQDKTRVRINLVAKALSNNGGIIWSQPVYDAKPYQNLFSKIDKAIFIEKENL